MWTQNFFLFTQDEEELSKKTDPRFGFKTEVKVLLVFLKVKVRYVVLFFFLTESSLNVLVIVFC